MDKVSGLARLVAVLVAIVGAFVAIPQAALVLVVLGLIAGLAHKEDNVIRLFLVVLVLPVAGSALGNIPQVGDYLNTIFGNIALAAAGVAAMVIALRIFNNAKDDVAGLTGK